MDRQEQRRLVNKALVVAVVLLLILTGVLLWLLTRPQPEPTAVPTGNVDVFDIDISCLCVGEDGEECDDDEGEDGENGGRRTSPGPEGYKNYQGSTINGHDNTTEDDDGIVYVDDINGNYIYQKNLKIFENPAFQYTNKIAPGVANSYDFKVHNKTKNTIRYNIVFTENSEYAVNMLYRLRREGSYVVGSDTEWVSAEDLVLSAKKNLLKNDTDGYTLDWQWPYEGGKDEADTEAGEKMTSDYKLGIKITFEEV